MRLPEQYKALTFLGLLGLVGCSFDGGGLAFTTDGGAGTPDAVTADADPTAPDADTTDADPAAPDADTSGPDAGHCPGDDVVTGPTNVPDPCDVPAPLGSWVMDETDWVLDTDNLTLDRTDDIGGSPQPITMASNVISQTDGPELLIISVDDFTMKSGFFTSELEVHGSRAVLIVAFGNVSIDGQIRAHGRGSTSGPGADQVVACADGFGSPGIDQGDGGSGGGGGGFGGKAGGGGKVDDGNSSMPVAVEGGDPNGTTLITPLRGGCRGGNGGHGGGNGGGGGGAIQFSANGSISVEGYVSVAGGGGRGPSANHAGGGGGGAGGAILLESATSIQIDGKLAANGGGGGEGKRGFWDGSNGDDGRHDSADTANGGSGLSEGGNGGRGGARNGSPDSGGVGSSSDSDDAGGGGGGGSIGRIRLISPSTNIGGGAVVSPAPQ